MTSLKLRIPHTMNEKKGIEEQGGDRDQKYKHTYIERGEERERWVERAVIHGKTNKLEAMIKYVENSKQAKIHDIYNDTMCQEQTKNYTMIIINCKFIELYISSYYINKSTWQNLICKLNSIIAKQKRRR